MMLHDVRRTVYLRQFNALPCLQGQRLSKNRLVRSANDKKTQLVLTFTVFVFEAGW